MRRRRFIDPPALMIAIDADRREIADPSEIGGGGKIGFVMNEQRIALGRRRRGMQQMRRFADGLSQFG